MLSLKYISSDQLIDSPYKHYNPPHCYLITCYYYLTKGMIPQTKALNMKTLSLIILLSTQVNAADIQCAKLKRFVRPVSKDAITLAKHLKVKTCNGQRFKVAVKEIGATIKMVRPTKAQIARYGVSKSASKVNLKSLFN